ncbi:MAG: GBS Bsp-like repeat-containing protein [Lachnospiraceae bacterium]|nr:GBS Bsp-like repeat-containing protein [Lachnospiraceae bacterium]
MRKAVFRFLALLLALSLCCGMLTVCADDAPDTVYAGESGAGTEAETETPEEMPDSETGEAEDRPDAGTGETEPAEDMPEPEAEEPEEAAPGTGPAVRGSRSAGTEFEETGIFSCCVTDANGLMIRGYQDPGSGGYYLFVPRTMRLADLSVSIGGIRMEKASKGTLAPDNTLTGAFAKSGDTVTLTSVYGDSYRITAMQSHLPGVYIRLNGASLADVHSNGKDVRYSGTEVIVIGADGSIMIDDPDVQFKGRGNTTWTYDTDKKGYQIKFEKKQTVLGMPKAKKWVLLANSFDDTLIRNSTSFHLAEQLGMPFVPDSTAVELWIDGDYRGSYTIGEKVEIDKNRLDLSDPFGVIAELDNEFYKDEDFYFYDTYLSKYFAIQEAVDEDTPGQAQAALERFHTRLDEFLSWVLDAQPTAITLEALSAYIDVDSFAKWYLVNEYTLNVECVFTSWFWYADGDDDLIHLGPVWDFDSCLGNFPEHSDADLLYMKDTNILFRKLMSAPEFASYVSRVFTQNRSAFSGLSSYASALGSELSASADMNFIRWPILGQHNVKNLYDNAPTYKAAVSRLTGWLGQRYPAFAGKIVTEPYADFSCKVSDDGRTLTVTAENVIGTDNIRAAIWTRTNGQDDLNWYDLAKTGNGTMSRTVDLTRHGGSDRYYVHIYTGTSTLMRIFDLDVEMEQSRPSVAAAYDAESGQIKITLTQAAGYDFIYFPVWSKADGQDDIKWYRAEYGPGGSVSYDVSVLSHKGYGTYYVHAYGSRNGEVTFLASATVEVPEMPKPELRVTVPDGSSLITVTLSNAADAANVRAAVWGTVNDQNDLKWYPMRKSGGVFETACDLALHGETGQYLVHVYGVQNGRDMFLGGETLTISGPAEENWEAESWEAQSDGAGGFTVTLRTAGTGIALVQIPVWNRSDQSDIVWYTASPEDGVYKVVSDISRHAYHTGTYQAHIYVTDTAGRRVCAAKTTFTVNLEEPLLSARLDEASDRIHIRIEHVYLPGGVKEVTFPVWTEEDGQDDLVWYPAMQTGNGIYEADIAVHSTPGRYIIHAYARDRSGNQVFLAADRDSVIVETSVKAVLSTEADLPGGTFRVIADVSAEGAKLSEVYFPVWASDDQSDLKWYAAARNAEGRYEAAVNIADHGGNQGYYRIHCYAKLSNGMQLFAGKTALDMKISSVVETVFSETRDRCRLILRGVPAGTKRVQFPTWSRTGDQDDLVWYEGDQEGDGSWTVDVDSASHRSAGVFYTHIYVTRYGRQEFLMPVSYTLAAGQEETGEAAPTGDAKYAGDRILAVVGGRLAEYDTASGGALRTYNIRANWLAVLGGGREVIVSDETRNVSYVTFDEDGGIESVTKLDTGGGFNIDPAAVRLEDGSILFTMTTVTGTVNNGDPSRECGTYTVKLYSLTGGAAAECIGEIRTVKRNIEDVILVRTGTTLYCVYEEELYDKGSSAIKMQKADISDFMWSEPVTLLKATSDHEPAAFLPQDDGSFLLYYSCDEEKPGSSYSGARAYADRFDRRFRRKSHEAVPLSSAAGILLYDVRSGTDGAAYLYAEDYPAVNRLVSERAGS